MGDAHFVTASYAQILYFFLRSGLIISRNFVKSKSEPLLSAKAREATLGEMNETVRSTSGTMNVIKRGQDNGLQENSGHV